MAARHSTIERRRPPGRPSIRGSGRRCASTHPRTRTDDRRGDGSARTVRAHRAVSHRVDVPAGRAVSADRRRVRVGLVGYSPFRLSRRRAGASERRRSGPHASQLAHVEVRISAPTNARAFSDAASVAAAARTAGPIVGQTELHDGRRKRPAILEYAVKTLNYLVDRETFQVDTDPMLWADLAPDEPESIDWLRLAHITYTEFGSAEFAKMGPTASAHKFGIRMSLALRPADACFRLESGGKPPHSKSVAARCTPTRRAATIDRRPFLRFEAPNRSTRTAGSPARWRTTSTSTVRTHGPFDTWPVDLPYLIAQAFPAGGRYARPEVRDCDRGCGLLASAGRDGARRPRLPTGHVCGSDWSRRMIGSDI